MFSFDTPQGLPVAEVRVCDARLPLNGYAVDLTPFLTVPPQQALAQIGCQPIFIEVPQRTIEEIYALSDACLVDHFEEVCRMAALWEQEFAASEESSPWMNVRFGIRDKRPQVHRKKDQKFYFQFCREYGEWVLQHHAAELADLPPLALLFRRLLEVDRVCQKVFLKKIEQLASHCPERKLLFVKASPTPRLLISFRVISYEPEGDLAVSPHYDKAAMSLLLPSDDAPHEECLIVAPADGTGFDPDKLRQPVRPTVQDASKASCGLFITGSMLEEIGIPIPATPHAVLPHDRPLRHVLVAFCNVPDMDTSHLNFAILHKKEMPPKFAERFHH